MARRLFRTVTKLALVVLFFLSVLYFLDLRYKYLPNSIHNRLDRLTHNHPGIVIVDITFSTCTVSCTMGDDWDQISKEVFLGKGWVSKGYVFVKRLQEEQVISQEKELAKLKKAKKKLPTESGKDGKIVLDVRVGRIAPPSSTEGTWESRAGGIWVLRGNDNPEKAISAVDILFGADAVEVRPGWEVKGTLTNGEEAQLTVRTGPLVPQKKPVVRIAQGGKFKMIQVSDLHLSTGYGACRDPYPTSLDGSKSAGCDADPRTLDFIGKILDEEKPHLAILSGDQVNGETAPDAQSALFKAVEPFIKRKIPYAIIFGNHDDEGSLSRAELMQIIETLPYSLSEAGPTLVDGVGNYYVEVLAHKSDHSAMTVYLLDSHSYSPDENKYKGYDWIRQNQIEWFKVTHEKLAPAHKEYALKHLDVAFIHIPLPEYRYASPENDNGPPVVGGKWREMPTAPNFNTHFRDVLVSHGISFISCGHDHANDYCMLDTYVDPKTLTEKHSQDGQKGKGGDGGNIWMCYAGGSGLGGYGGYNNYIRRVRLFEMDTQAERVVSYTRVEFETEDEKGKVNEFTMVDAGEVVSP